MDGARMAKDMWSDSVQSGSLDCRCKSTRDVFHWLPSPFDDVVAQSGLRRGQESCP